MFAWVKKLFDVTPARKQWPRFGPHRPNVEDDPGTVMRGLRRAQAGRAPARPAAAGDDGCFATSAVVGAMTDNPLLGKMVGGSFAGGMMGASFADSRDDLPARCSGDSGGSGYGGGSSDSSSCSSSDGGGGGGGGGGD